MSDPRSTEAQEATLQAERELLWKRWSSGDLAPHCSQLMAFAEQQGEAILAMANNSTDPQSLVFAAKRMVVEFGTVHHPTEMRDQMREIHDYIWYHGEKGDHDRDRIMQDWTVRHAASWRRWRLKEYLFVIDRIAEEITARIRKI